MQCLQELAVVPPLVPAARARRPKRLNHDLPVGIRASALSTIFRAFQRADDSRPDGLGLGLYIVKHAAALLGHRVEVRSVEERGSTFTVIAEAARPELRPED